MARSDQYSLSLQMPILAAASALAVGLCLLWMAVRASDYVQGQQEALYAQALADQVAESVRESLQSGDLLAARATLERYVVNSLALSIEVRDVEGTALGSAGERDGSRGSRHRAPVTIGGDIAGEVILAVDRSATQESRWRMLSSLLALAVALSLLVFLGIRFYATRLAMRLRALESELTLPGADDTCEALSEVTRLEERVADLPLDMLRGHAPVPIAATEFSDSALLFIHLASLARYVDTLSESNLHRYTRRLQQIIQASAHCYRGDMKVARPFGLLLNFSHQPGAPSEALRAASCARLIERIATGLAGHTSLSIDVSMALGHCEEDADDVEDIYPELHLQGAIDDLRSACLARGAADGPRILLDRRIREDEHLRAATLAPPATPALTDADFQALERLADEQEALLEHQAHLIVERIAPGRS